MRIRYGYFAGLALREIVGCRDRRDVDGFFGGAHRRQRIAGRGQHAADEHLDLVLKNQFLCFGDAEVGLGLVVLEDELDVHAAELVAVLVEIELETVVHVLADLREQAGHRRNEADAQFFRLRRRRKTRPEQQQQRGRNL